MTSYRITTYWVKPLQKQNKMEANTKIFLVLLASTVFATLSTINIFTKIQCFNGQQYPKK